MTSYGAILARIQGCTWFVSQFRSGENGQAINLISINRGIYDLNELSRPTTRPIFYHRELGSGTEERPVHNTTNPGMDEIDHG